LLCVTRAAAAACAAGLRASVLLCLSR
jgi:hypothetical protein